MPQCNFSSAADTPTGYGKRKILNQVFILRKALASGFFITSYALYRTGADIGLTPKMGLL